MKREPALMLPLSELKGEYVKGKEEFDTNYLITNTGGKISRANVWGNIVKKYETENFVSITIDDFSDTIDVMVFENIEILKTLKLGQVVRIIGKIRQGKNGFFILCEGVQKLSFEGEMLARAQIKEFFEKWKKKNNKNSVQEESIGETKKPESFFTEADKLDIKTNIIE